MYCNKSVDLEWPKNGSRSKVKLFSTEWTGWHWNWRQISVAKVLTLNDPKMGQGQKSNFLSIGWRDWLWKWRQGHICTFSPSSNRLLTLTNGVKVKGQGHMSKLGQSWTETRHQTKYHSPMKHAQTYTSHPLLRFKWPDHRCTCTQVYTSTQKMWSIIASYCQPILHPCEWSVLNP